MVHLKKISSNYDKIAEFWDEIYPITRDLEFWATIPSEEFPAKRPTELEILELGTGTGRVSLYLCKRGYMVHGLENSPKMRTVCRKNFRKLLPQIQGLFKLHKGDMRNFNLSPLKFDIIICPFNTWLDLLEKEERISTLNSVYNHLKADGIFIIDIFSRKLSDMKTGTWNLWDYETGQKFYPYLDINLSWCEYATIHPNKQLEQIEINLTKVKNGFASNFSEKFFIKLLNKEEVENELKDCGFVIKQIYSTYEKQPWNIKSPYIIFIVCKSK